MSAILFAIEHVSSRLWPFGIMHQVWRGKGEDGVFQLQRRLFVLFHFVNFHLKRRILYEPPGVWPLIPPGQGPVRVTVYPDLPANEKKVSFL